MHVTILVIKSPPTQNFPLIKSTPKSKSSIYLCFIPPSQPSGPPCAINATSLNARTLEQANSARASSTAQSSKPTVNKPRSEKKHVISQRSPQTLQSSAVGLSKLMKNAGYVDRVPGMTVAVPLSANRRDAIEPNQQECAPASQHSSNGRWNTAQGVLHAKALMSKAASSHSSQSR
eukprot:COSAG05_NODE_955_length_6434_cov_15.147119_6_plen_175_part_01